MRAKCNIIRLGLVRVQGRVLYSNYFIHFYFGFPCLTMSKSVRKRTTCTYDVYHAVTMQRMTLLEVLGSPSP